MVAGSFIAIVFFADFVISTAVKGVTDDYTSRFMRGTIVLIEDELFRRPRSDWSRALKKLDDKFLYRLDIVDRWSLKLPKKQAEQLDAGELAVAKDGTILYHRLKQTSQVLVVGPISPDADPNSPRALPLELRIRLLTWSLVGLCLAVAVWLWVRPVWRDLEALRQTAKALGDGNFEMRAPAAHSGAFILLTTTLNGMAERIQRLIATQKQLSSAISHELRTPIARMRFALEMLVESNEYNERERLWQTMEADLDELDNLIDSSLTYARFEREQPEARLTQVELLPWLVEKVASVQMLKKDLDLQLDSRAFPPEQRVELDLKNMPYALVNLLRNAIKYAKTTIIVSGEVSGTHLKIHVDDDGIGVEPKDRLRIFDAFTRIDNSRDRSTGGYGLGLAIVRLVLDQHNGSVSVSESPLGGARFTLDWPLESRTEKPTNPT